MSEEVTKEEMVTIVAMKPIDGCAVGAEIELPKAIAGYMVENGAAETPKTPGKASQVVETSKASSNATKDASKGVGA